MSWYGWVLGATLACQLTCKDLPRSRFSSRPGGSPPVRCRRGLNGSCEVQCHATVRVQLEAGRQSSGHDVVGV